MAKYVFVTGGVVSGLGKGVLTASLGCLLRARGVAVTLQKIDPYLNVDAGTINPYEHGEVFVTNDGLETDLDIGHYERFLDQDLGHANYLTTGQVYWSVIQRERRGDYLGRTVQVIPHVTEEIKARMRRALEATGSEVVVVEVGGTVGDIEGLPYLEAIRQMRDELPREDVAVVHLAYVPILSTTGELKTKPTQHSVKELRAAGIQPDFIVARCPVPLPENLRRKIALFCDVPVEHVIEDRDLPSIYEVPLFLADEGFDLKLLRRLDLSHKDSDLRAWHDFVRRLKNSEGHVRIAVVGKYVELHDAYLSIVEALRHAGAALGMQVEIQWVPAERVEKEGEKALAGVQGILVPGGFGERGIEGKVWAADYARRQKIPFFGICLGMQVAAIAFARHVLGRKNANSTEFDAHTRDPVIDLLPEQKKIQEKGGTMRLGAYPAELTPGTRVHAAYGLPRIAERHRHRYEFNLDYLEDFVRAGFIPAAFSPDGRLVEALELREHPWYVAVQFHPEFQSRPLRPHPLFLSFLRACSSS
ncbi:MAG: CTP synthase [Candidatus Bipolaricaulota bacterium]|nr:CTP synthase [Candidatus Bipolaricaulota bacterium]MDW8126974.1 CTP synthase [Candidatus Bipolaricaulota bacterium]